ncbi:MAG: aryl-sulfate sulfotransferase [Niabella sp.]
MEIILRAEAIILRYIKLPGILLCLVVLIHSCSRTDALPSQIPSRSSLQQMADNGSLLNHISQNGSVYTFSFETGDLQVPLNEIKKITEAPERWKTMLTFSDGSTLVIPSKGGSLDFIVEDIKLNPSGYNPLAAMVYVYLPASGRVKVTVHGKNGETGAITHLCHEKTERQGVPVFGLYADYDNKVDLTFTDKNGNERGSTQIHIRTEPLPVTGFPVIKVISSQPKKMEPGMNLIGYPGMSELDVSLPYFVDAEGNIRWILLLKSSPELQKLSSSVGFKRTKKGTFITGDQSQARIVEIDMFGNLLRQWDLKKSGYAFHHEVTESKNGNYLVTVTKSSARLTDGKPRIYDFIIELNPFDNSIVKEWDLATMVDTTRYIKSGESDLPPEYAQNPTNWAHNNAITEIGDDLLATLRFQGIISYTRSGNLRWIISPHKDWGAKYRPYLLNPVDEKGNAVTDPAVINGDAATEGFDWPWGMHSPVVLPDNNILVFDNGYNRNWIANSKRDKNYSRIVEYKISESNRTVQQVWSYGKELGAGGFSSALSGVQYLTVTNNVLFCPGMGVPTSIGTGGKVIEIDLQTKEVIFEMEIATPSGTAFHRVTRLPLYPDSI